MFCCFTGHRPQQLPWGTNEASFECLQLKKALANAVKEAVSDGYTDFYCGMAMGIDMYAAEAVIELKQYNSDIKLHAALPCLDQSEKWNDADRARYDTLLSKCDSRIIISPFYTNTCMLTRNRFMVDNSNRLIAVWNGSFRGGTAYTVKYAKAQKKEIYLIRPKDASITTL